MGSVGILIVYMIPMCLVKAYVQKIGLIFLIKFDKIKYKVKDDRMRFL